VAGDETRDIEMPDSRSCIYNFVNLYLISLEVKLRWCDCLDHENLVTAHTEYVFLWCELRQTFAINEK